MNDGLVALRLEAAWLCRARRIITSFQKISGGGQFLGWHLDVELDLCSGEGKVRRGV